MGLRSASLAALAALVAVGLFAASPFFNRGLVGTGEAFNYSLSVADAVTQMRHGILPPLAGQTEYAFNGRMHPLRNAPYLHYLCGAIDLVTFHQLAFWQLQNVSLILSLFGALAACYGGLRGSTECPRPLALFLASVYALAPPLLGAAYTYDLYMTVHAAVFVPLALAACVRGCRSPSFSNDAWLAAALAAAWLTHPPVAFWLTASCVVVKVVAFLGSPRLGILASGLLSAVLGFVLASFVFISAATLSTDLGYFAGKQEMWSHFSDVILHELRSNFPECLLPVSAGAGKLSDLQLGYASWILLGLATVLVLRRSPGEGNGKPVRLTAAGCALAAVLLLVLDLPVPYLTHWLWQHAPSGVLELTTEWPMQRLYLVAVGLCVFGAGVILPRRWSSFGAPRWVGPAAVAVGFGWILYEARPFIKRGIGDRSALTTTQSSYLPSNLNLTITSYAFVGPPPTYVHGVMDPNFEFRILMNGKDEIASPYATGLAQAPVVQTGAIALKGGLAPDKTAVSPTLTLIPGHRYLLSFGFRTPPVKALLSLRGPVLNRTYILPEAGEVKGFGMMDGQRRAIPLWTDSDKPEPIEIRVWITPDAVLSGKPTVFADYTLQDVDMKTLPVRLGGLLPLRFTVDAPQAGCTVETFRRYLPGYVATVNGKPATPLMSPYRQVMIPLPAGRSVVELSYPGPLEARRAFWICVSSWLLFFLWRACGSWVPARPWALVAVPGIWVWRHRWISLATAVLVGVMGVQARNRAVEDAVLRAVGPVRIDFQLPYGQKNVSEPLFATGHAGAGVVIFVHFIDESHIRLGADVWGSLYESRPIEVDYSENQTLVVSDGALYPQDNPRVRNLAPDEAERLRSELRVELNGNTEIHAVADCYRTKLSEILVGHTVFGSLTGPDFLGRVLKVERLPIPRIMMLPASRHARLEARFPFGRDGHTEPFLGVAAGMERCLCAVTYLAEGRLRLSLAGNDGRPFESADIAYDPAEAHRVDFWPSAGGGDARPLALSGSFDGRQILGTGNSGYVGSVPILHSGVNSASTPEVEARFTGQELTLSSVPNSDVPRVPSDWGTGELVVTFPLNRTGRHEPILTTGVTGAGDFVYIIYEDAHHVRLGLDHWNGMAFVSDPIAVDYQAPHEIWISTGALYPAKAGDPTWDGIPPAEQSRLRTQVRVFLDGKAVISSATTTYPTGPGQVTFFENRIGGSTADANFTGIVHFLQRMGPRPVFP
jgi:hypothetical protein